MNYEDATWRCNRWVSQLLRILSQTTCMLIINFIQYFQLNITLHGFHFIKQFSTRQEFLVLISQNYISRALNLKFHVMYMNNVVLHWFHEIFSRVIYYIIVLFFFMYNIKICVKSFTWNYTWCSLVHDVFHPVITAKSFLKHFFKQIIKLGVKYGCSLSTWF